MDGYVLRGISFFRMVLCNRVLFPCVVWALAASSSASGQVTARVSLEPAQVKAGTASETEYRFDITAGQSTAFAIRFSWAVSGAVVKAIEKDGTALWLLNTDSAAPQSTVATWTYSPLSNRLTIQTFAGDLDVNNRLTVRIVFQVRDSAGIDTLFGYAGSSLQSLNLCNGNPILEVNP